MAIHHVVLGLTAAHPGRHLRAAGGPTPLAPERGNPTRKTVRGHALGIHGGAELAPRAAPVHLGPSMTAQEAFAAIALNCSAHIMVSAKFTAHSDDPEGVHELRVAIRRMRAALSIFQDAAAANRRFRIGNELRVLQRKLGAAREWDVLIDETIGQFPRRLRRQRVVHDVVKRAEAKRAAGHKAAHAVLRDPRCRDLLRRLHAWIDSQFIYGPPRLRDRRWKPEILSQPVTGFAAEIMQAYHGKARKLAENIRELDAKDLHRLRIRVKKLRYATEFFASLWHGRPLRRYLAALKELQEGLGTWHDTVVATDLFARLAAAGRADGKFATTPAGRWLAKRERALRREVGDLWDRLAKRKPFWEGG